MLNGSRARVHVAASLLHGWRIGWSVGGLILLSITLAASPKLIVLPQVLADSEVTAPAAVVATLVGSLLLLPLCVEPASHLIATAPRGRQIAVVIRLAVMTVVAYLAIVLPAHAGGWAPISALATFTGEGLILAGTVGVTTAWTLPTVHCLAAMTFGADVHAKVASWAWVVSGSPSASFVTVSLAIYAIGLAVMDRSAGRGRNAYD